MNGIYGIDYEEFFSFLNLVTKKSLFFKNEFGDLIFHQLKKYANEYSDLFNKETEYSEMVSILDNDDDKNLIQKERLENLSKLNLIIEKIKIILLYESNQNILMEIRPGTGGIEASIFAKDLYQMYFLFSKKMEWNIEMVESRVDKEGNLFLFSFLIKGKDVFAWLKNEAGVHRVQRIPKTENKGRIHTSTATIAILPEFKDLDIKISQQDLRIDTYRSSGAGGQHVNTTDSAVRITHIPTGITAYSQDGRSQHSNKERAMFIIKSRISEKIKKDDEEKKESLRSSMIGSAERSEKIRTYNWSQNRLTDHRLKISWNNLNYFLEGNLRDLCQKLIDYELKNKISNIINLINNDNQI